MDKLRVWCLLRDQLAHVQPVEEFFGDRAEFVCDENWEPSAIIKARPHIVLCVNDFHYEVSRCLDAARAVGIPTLVIQDGILEWRCQYENPAFGQGGGAPQHQPVIADKIACIGQQSARQIAAWGNSDKIEVTGMPRLDYLLARDFAPRRRPGRRILVMTAKTPGFTPEQVKITLRSLHDLKGHLDSRPDVEVIWRVRPALAAELQIENHLRELASQELVQIIEQVDAVITTPSTSILEAMLMERPVAVLDYHNVPRFVPTAWTASAREHISRILAELLDPPGAKLAFQRDCLHDCLECDGQAAERVAELIGKMVTFARDQQGANRQSRLPANLLNRTDATPMNRTLDLSELYPGKEAFSIVDVQALQVRLARAEKENERLQLRVQARGLGYWIFTLGRRLAQCFR